LGLLLRAAVVPSTDDGQHVRAGERCERRAARPSPVCCKDTDFGGGRGGVWQAVAVRRAAALLALAALAGCGASGGDRRVPSATEAREALAGAPPALAALHAQAGDVLGGGRAAFERRLRALRGHPVVVSKWASWCAPCRSEWPVWQRVSVTLGKRVAFLGLDARDPTAKARKYLRRHPVSYPSYADPRERISAAIPAPEGFPITSFFDRRGRLTYQHAGPYRSDAALVADVRRYALGT
jgi:cytochrome c biogenesis protein CcmG, thiol:disulfide interchange protein DsbE